MGLVLFGKQRADELVVLMHDFVRTLPQAPRMVAITADPDAPTKQFLRIKEKVASRAGIVMRTIIFDGVVVEAQIRDVVASAVAANESIVLQLPLPPHINLEQLLALIPRVLDPDCIGMAARDAIEQGDFSVLPPVVSVIRTMSEEFAIPLTGRAVVVVGQGRLVGAPAARWLEHEGAHVVRLTKHDGNLLEAVGTADVLVLGAGVPGLVTPTMIKDGVVIFDAGTSEEGGRVVGDANPACSEKASIFTPVPGGIGPIAVAELFANMLRLQHDFKG